MNLLKLLLSSMIALILTVSAQAEQKKVFGDYEIHYIVLNSTFMKPETARAYGLDRSKNLGYVSISVLRKAKDKGKEKDQEKNLPTPVNAELTLIMSNLIGQKKTIELKRIEETGAVYYLNTFSFDNEDVYNFYLTAKPENHGRSYDFRFSQKMYAEDY